MLDDRWRLRCALVVYFRIYTGREIYLSNFLLSSNMPSILFSLSVVILVAKLATGQNAGITCDQTGPSKCTKPALDYFIRRYEDRKINPPTDERWSKDMLKQCQLDDEGRKCLITFARQCLPPQQVQQMNLDMKQNSTCEEKVDRLTKGCKPDSSVWFRTCENPLVERLHSFLTMKPPTAPPTQTETQRLHTQICCEIDHYSTCITDKAKDNHECNDTSSTIFQHIITDMRGSYQCNPSTSFSGIQC